MADRAALVNDEEAQPQALPPSGVEVQSPDKDLDLGLRCADDLDRALVRPAHVLVHGLRPYRPGVRLESEPFGGGVLWHNYGHGGAGVSLSWGCAAEITAAVLSPGASLAS